MRNFLLIRFSRTLRHFEIRVTANLVDEELASVEDVVIMAYGWAQ